jgi:hypothetical protein
MMSISQLLSAPTSDQIRSQMVLTLVSLNVPADKWRKGGALSTMLTVVSMVYANLASLLSTAVNGFFLPTASGGGLVLLAYYVYGITVPTATQATGQVTLTNTQGGVFSGSGYDVGQVVFQNEETGNTYTNVEAINLSAAGGPNPTQTVDVVATVFGTVGNALAGDVSIIQTSMLGVDVSNAFPIVGTDPPTDAAVRTLCLNSLGARSVRGPRTAYAFAIQSAVNSVTGAPVNVNRWSISNSSHTGQTTIYVASPAGPVDPNDLTGIKANIEQVARPGAVTVTTAGAVTSSYNGGLTLWCTAPSGTTALTLAQAAAAGITAFMGDPTSSPIGGVSADDDANPEGFIGMFVDGVRGAAAAAIAAAGGKMVAAQGLVDLALAANEVAINNISITVRITPTGSP